MSFRAFLRLFVSFRILVKTRKDTKRQQQYIRSRLIRVYSHCIMSLGCLFVSFRVFSCVFSCLFVSFRVFSSFSMTHQQHEFSIEQNFRLDLCVLIILFFLHFYVSLTAISQR